MLEKERLAVPSWFMSDFQESGPRKIPYNPGLQRLVNAKRTWSRGRDGISQGSGFQGWHERGYLPHRDEPGLIQFVTFQLLDSYPESLRSEWEHLHSIENNNVRIEKLQAYLDLGKGECVLSRPPAASVVDEAFRFHHEVTYELRAWVVMSNHVHVMFKTFDVSMGRIVGNWKEFTAKQVNRFLSRRGALWAADYWDTYVRDAEHERRVREYIEHNPVKAGLVRCAADWLWSSARWRDEFGRLVLP